MEILKFDNAPQKRVRQKKSSTGGLLAVAGFAMVAVLGSTLAANITLNSGSLEFGQGIATTTACDGDGINLTPKAVFTNNSASGSFSLASVAFSGISTNCANKVFTLNAYDNSSATPLNIASVGLVSYNVATFVFSATLPGSPYITTNGYSANAAEIGFKGTQATSGAVYKITLQSSDN